MWLIKKLVPGAVPAMIIRWFLDSTHGAERRAKAWEVATDAGRRVRAGARQLRATLAARRAVRGATLPGPPRSQSSRTEASASRSA